MLPIVVLQLPVAIFGQFAVVKATRAVGLGRPEPSVGSLILDVAGYGMVALLIWLFLGLRSAACSAVTFGNCKSRCTRIGCSPTVSRSPMC